jgi:hypothetical protein
VGKHDPESGVDGYQTSVFNPETVPYFIVAQAVSHEPGEVSAKDGSIGDLA